MNPIGDVPVEVYKAIAIEAKENLVRAKLRETVKDLMYGVEQSENNSLNNDKEIYVLQDVLKKAGFTER